MVNELKRILFDFWKNDSFLLINKFLLFQYSEGIFSVSRKADLESCTEWSRAHALSNTHKINDQIPREPPE